MLMHNTQGIVNEVRVLHEPTGTRFTVTITLASPEPNADFETWLEAPIQVQRFIYNSGWRLLRIAMGPHFKDDFRFLVEYDQNRRQFTDLPTVKIEAPRSFQVEFVTIKPHPRISAKRARRTAR